MHQLAHSPSGQITTTDRSRFVATLAAVLACLAFPSSAAASDSGGALRQHAGTAGCLSQTGTGGTCTDVRGVDGAQFVTVSPDGRHAYVASVVSHAVAAFSRSEGGDLQQLEGSDGCVARPETEGSIITAEGCAPGRGLERPDWITLSPDGANAYVTSAESDATAVFSRDPVSGVLTQLPGAAGCVSSSAGEGSCSVGRALDFPAGVVLSPDGSHVYVASFQSDAIAVFSRNSTTGELTQLAGQAGCVSETVSSCAQAGSMDGLVSVAVSPDGEHVYATARWSKAVTVYARDAATGALTRLAGTDGCVAAVASATCARANGLPGPNTVVTSPDGAHVYIGSYIGSSLAVFSRDPGTGKLTQLPGDRGCFNGDGTQPACAPATALDGTFSLTHSPNGRNVYVAAYDSDAVSVFSRDASAGALAQLEGTDGCVSNDGTGGRCARVGVLDGAHHIAMDPEGKHVYAPANISDAVSVFDVLPGGVEPPDPGVTPGPGGPTGPGTSTAPSTPGTGSVRPLRFSLSLRPPRELLTTLRRGLRVPVRCATPCRVRVSALVDRSTARRARLGRRGRSVLVGRGASRRTAAGQGFVRVRFTRDARRRLRRLERVRLVLRTTVTDGAGDATTRTSRVTLRRHRPRLRSVLRRGFTVWATCSSDCRAGGRLVLGRREARSLGLGRRPVVVARTAAALPAGRQRAVRLRFSRRARTALARVRKTRLTLRMEARGSTGTVRAARRIVLRR